MKGKKGFISFQDFIDFQNVKYVQPQLFKYASFKQFESSKVCRSSSVCNVILWSGQKMGAKVAKQDWIPTEFEFAKFCLCSNLDIWSL